MEKGKTLYLVVPCYNEEEVLGETTKRLKEKFENLIKKGIISSSSRVMYVNDGSKDKTWELIEKFHKDDKIFTGLCLSRNRGHQNALLAGLLTAKNYADVVISMDADLQDDINAMDEMLDKYYEGSDIVYGVRSSRKTDTWFKRTTALGFYKFMAKMGVNVVYNHADYRLTSVKVLEEFSKFKEVNLFLRGMFPLVGFKSDVVYYERSERFAGESKYPLKKMLNFAWDGITSFSTKPIRYILGLGIFNTFVGSLGFIVLLILKLCAISISDLVLILSFILLCLGVQLIAIGIVGEYVAKAYIETKERPRFIISKNLEEK